MAYQELKALKSVEVAYEDQDTFGTNLSGSATFYPIPTMEAAFSPTRENASPEIHQQSRLEREKVVQLRNKGEISFGMLMQGQNAGNGYQHLKNQLVTIMGGLHTGTNTNLLSATSGALTVVDASEFVAGGCVSWNHPTTGKIVTRYLRAVDTTNNILFPKIPVASSELPVSGNTIYNADNIFFKQNDITGSLQFKVREKTDQNCWYVAGCQGGFEIEHNLGELANIKFSYQYAKDYHAGDTEAPLTKKTYNLRAAPANIDSEFLVITGSTVTTTGTISTTVPVKTRTHSWTLTPNIGIQAMEVVHGTNNIELWQPSVTRPTLQAVVLQRNNAGSYEYVHARDSEESDGTFGTPMIAEGRVGSAVDKCYAIGIGKAQIETVELGDVAGMAAQTLGLVMFENDAIATSTNTEIALSPFVISFPKSS